jgi:hypothetical protein
MAEVRRATQDYDLGEITGNTAADHASNNGAKLPVCRLTDIMHLNPVCLADVGMNL